jgi:hypothetical protein
MLLAAVLWTLLLVGLFVMHGAGSHGASSHASAPVADVIALTAGDGGPVDHHGDAQSGEPAQDSEDERESPGHSAAELCLAILCALLSGLAALVALTRPSRPQFTVRRFGAALNPPWRRPPDPPRSIRLSILRC